VTPLLRPNEEERQMITEHNPTIREISPTARSEVRGVWLPLVTPFKDGALDEVSLRRLLRHLAARPVDGLVIAATTGEGPLLEEREAERLAAVAAEELGDLIPIYLGLSGSDTLKMEKQLHRIGHWPVAGYLISSPSYVRPSQEGLTTHFARLAEASERPVLLYNVPTRTGVNLANDTLLRLAELPTVIGVKDCCGDAAQSLDLIRRKPPGFAVMTGEDAQFHVALAQGADGGILCSAHVETERFAAVHAAHRDDGDIRAALKVWHDLADLTRLLFAEPSPAPVKYWLYRQGLIDSPEVRLPLTTVSPALAERIDRAMGHWNGEGRAA
jgi:4-hydroxy-tetrahydrodipicolinate synthase